MHKQGPEFEPEVEFSDENQLVRNYGAIGTEGFDPASNPDIESLMVWQDGDEGSKEYAESPMNLRQQKRMIKHENFVTMCAIAI